MIGSRKKREETRGNVSSLGNDRTGPNRLLNAETSRIRFASSKLKLAKNARVGSNSLTDLETAGNRFRRGNRCRSWGLRMEIER